MHELADTLAAGLVTVEDDLAREFETRLADSSTLAFRVAYSIVRQKQDAEDVAQDAFARAYRRFDQLRDRERFRAWLVRMTWRLAIDFKRAQRRRTSREDSAARLVPSATRGEPDAIERDRSARLWQAIDVLPDRLRIVVVLAAIEGHTVHDVASAPGRAGRHDQIKIVRGARTTARDAAMTNDHPDDVLKDLETALAVSPSPEFAEGVRARIADGRSRQKFSLAWPLAIAGALATIVLVALVTQRKATVAAPPASFPLTAVSSAVVAPAAGASRSSLSRPRISTPA